MTLSHKLFYFFGLLFLTLALLAEGVDFLMGDRERELGEADSFFFDILIGDP